MSEESLDHSSQTAKRQRTTSYLDDTFPNTHVSLNGQPVDGSNNIHTQQLNSKTPLNTVNDQNTSVVRRKVSEVLDKNPFPELVKREYIDFDLAKSCTVTVNTHNVFCCLTCGLYLHGKSHGTPAYDHALKLQHYIYISFDDSSFWVIPDDIEFIDDKLDDIKEILNPSEKSLLLHNNIHIHKTNPIKIAYNNEKYIPGIRPINCISSSSWFSSCLYTLNCIKPIRDLLLSLETRTISTINHLYNNNNIILSYYNDLLSSTTSSLPFLRLLSLCIKNICHTNVLRAQYTPFELLQQAISLLSPSQELSKTGSSGISAATLTQRVLNQGNYGIQPNKFFVIFINKIQSQLQEYAKARKNILENKTSIPDLSDKVPEKLSTSSSTLQNSSNSSETASSSQQQLVAKQTTGGQNIQLSRYSMIHDAVSSSLQGQLKTTTVIETFGIVSSLPKTAQPHGTSSISPSSQSTSNDSLSDMTLLHTSKTSKVTPFLCLNLTLPEEHAYTFQNTTKTSTSNNTTINGSTMRSISSSSTTGSSSSNIVASISINELLSKYTSDTGVITNMTTKEEDIPSRSSVKTSSTSPASTQSSSSSLSSLQLSTIDPKYTKIIIKTTTYIQIIKNPQYLLLLINRLHKIPYSNTITYNKLHVSLPYTGITLTESKDNLNISSSSPSSSSSSSSPLLSHDDIKSAKYDMICNVCYDSSKSHDISQVAMEHIGNLKPSSSVSSTSTSTSTSSSSTGSSSQSFKTFIHDELTSKWYSIVGLNVSTRQNTIHEAYCNIPVMILFKKR